MSVSRILSSSEN